jgi:hypothetical protein
MTRIRIRKEFNCAEASSYRPCRMLLSSVDYPVMRATLSQNRQSS